MGVVYDQHDCTRLILRCLKIQCQDLLELGNARLRREVEHEGFEHFLEELGWASEHTRACSGYHLIALRTTCIEIGEGGLARAIGAY